MSNLKKEERPFHRIAYFLRALAREATPDALHHARLRRHLTRLAQQSPTPEDAARINYSCKLTSAPQPERPLASYSRDEGALYYIDLLERARGYGRDTPLDALFGDITTVPPRPMLVKSRPIDGDNANSVLFPLNRFRHFQFPEDPVAWAAKTPRVVWRGRLNNQMRRDLVARFHSDPAMDIGHVTNRDVPGRKGWLTHAEQLSHRYILSLEGNDVATNLKWVMGSNALAISPPLQFETWYMEGRLQPDTHFLAVRPDFADLEDRIAWAEANPEAVHQIISNANAWTQQFRQPRKEADLAARTLHRYLTVTGAIDPAAWPSLP